MVSEILISENVHLPILLLSNRHIHYTKVLKLEGKITAKLVKNSWKDADTDFGLSTRSFEDGQQNLIVSMSCLLSLSCQLFD